MASLRGWIAALMISMGCGPAPEGGVGSSSGGVVGAGSGTTGLGSGSSAAAETTAGIPEGPGLARGGIRIERVQANQGVGVDIGREGQAIPPRDHEAQLLRGRVTLIRALWTVPDDWEPREIEGRLLVRWPDGTEETYRDTKVVDDDAFEGDLGRTFFWGLMADQTVPGVEFRVELWETSTDHQDLPASASPPTLPEEDETMALVGVQDTYQVMKVVLVPFDYDDGAGCVTSPDTSRATMQRFEDLLYMQNPLDAVEFTVHDNILWDTPLTGFHALNVFMAGLRVDERALPEVYYYGLIDACAGSVGGFGGQALGIPINPVSVEAASQRVSSGLWIDREWSAELFVHEVGHSQGRYHVACNGEEAGPDTSYPFEGGQVGEWGFGVVDFQLRHPTVSKDYMTYCHPTWVGRWGWNLVHPTIAGLSEWDEGFPGGGAPDRDPSTQARGPAHAPELAQPGMLLGAIEPSGAEHWITVPGGVPSGHAAGTTAIELRWEDGVVETVGAVTQVMPDGFGGTLVMAPLPRPGHRIVGVTRLEGDVRHPVAPRSIDAGRKTRWIRR